MAIFAVAIILLLTVAIYSLSKMETAPWASPLAELRIQDTFRKNLPQFEYMDGNYKLTPQNFQGKWTLLSFWSYSCPPCLAEMPSLNQMALNWSGPELAVVTVNVDDESSENFELAKSFLQDEGIVLPTIFDKQKILTNAFAVQVYPKHFLINPKGEMIWEAQGSYDWDSSQSRDNLVKLIEQQTPETVQDLAE